MENMLEVKRVPFMGAELMAVRDRAGQIWAGVKWLCNGIGLSRGQANGEIAKVQADEVLAEGCTKFHAGVFDPNNATVALKLDFVPLWLAKISITPAMKEERPELAATLKEYQLRAKDVLAAAFLPNEHQEPRSAMDMLRLQSAAMLELDDRVTDLEDKVDNQMTIDHGQQRQLQKVVGERVYERAAEAFPPSKVKANVGPFFKAIYRDLKDRFGVPSYRDIRPVDLAAAVAYAENWIEPADLRREAEKYGQ